MYRRLTLSLSDDEAAALAAMARQDRRYPKQQIGWLIVEAAKRRGLLADERQRDKQQIEVREPVQA